MPLVSVTDIAKITFPRVGRTAVSNWITKFNSGPLKFPAPVVKTKAFKLFELADIIIWINNTYKVGRIRAKTVPLEEIHSILELSKYRGQLNHLLDLDKVLTGWKKGA